MNMNVTMKCSMLYTQWLQLHFIAGHVRKKKIYMCESAFHVQKIYLLNYIVHVVQDKGSMYYVVSLVLHISSKSVIYGELVIACDRAGGVNGWESK